MTNLMNTPTGKVYRWTIADRLRVARESVTSSQTEFALMSKISRNTVSNYENGLPTTLIYVERWAEASGFDLNWILTGEEPGGTGGGGKVLPLEPRETAGEQDEERSGCKVVGGLPAWDYPIAS